MGFLAWFWLKLKTCFFHKADVHHSLAGGVCSLTQLWEDGNPDSSNSAQNHSCSQGIKSLQSILPRRHVAHPRSKSFFVSKGWFNTSLIRLQRWTKMFTVTVMLLIVVLCCDFCHNYLSYSNPGKLCFIGEHGLWQVPKHWKEVMTVPIYKENNDRHINWFIFGFEQSKILPLQFSSGPLLVFIFL